MVIWHCAKTNKTAPNPDIRSHDQPFMYALFEFLSLIISHISNDLTFSVVSVSFILQGFERTQFSQTLHKNLPKFPSTSREGSPRPKSGGWAKQTSRSQIRFRICTKKQAPTKTAQSSSLLLFFFQSKTNLFMYNVFLQCILLLFSVLLMSMDSD